MDPLAGSPWSAPDTVAGFAQSPPNAVLLRYAETERQRSAHARVLDLGCGAGRNAVPLARQGWDVVATDLWPMLSAAAQRARDESIADRLHLILAPMDRIPLRDRSVDLVVAHGIWNLARSVAEFQRAVGEAARVVRPGAGLFVFTFSRNTFPAEAQPIPGESFVFTQFSGRPQCFLTEDQLRSELEVAGFVADPGVPFTEYNRPQPGLLAQRGGAPTIYEGAFRYAPKFGEAMTGPSRG
jgi:SAM-dependent methyltransferase